MTRAPRLQRRASRRLCLALLFAGLLLTLVLAKLGFGLWSVTWPWLLSMVASVALALPARPFAGWRARLAAHRWDVAALAGVTLLAGALRLPGLEHMPLGIDGDETQFGLLAVQVVHGHGPPPFGVAFLGDPALYMHILGLSVRLFGPTMAALRLPAALAGTLTIPVVCGFVWDLYGRRPALIAGLLLSLAAAHIHFSRLALNVIEVPLFACLSLWFLGRGFRSGRDLWYLLAGIFGGLGFYFHFGARLTGLMLVLALLGQQLAARGPWRRWLRAVALTGAGAFLALSPMIAYLSGRPRDFTTHMVERGIWNSWVPIAQRFHLAPHAYGRIILEELWQSLAAFIDHPDPYWGASFYTFMNAPLLNHVAAPLALLGLLLLWLKLRDWRAQLILIWFVVPLIFASALTDVAGQSHRLVNPLVPAVIAAALLLDGLIRLATRRLPARLAPAAALAILALPAAAGARESLHYFDPAVTGSFRPFHTAQARCLQALPPNTVVLIDGAPTMFADDGPSQYLSPQVERHDLPNPAADLPYDTGGRQLVILVHEWRQDDLPQIRIRYPNAQELEIDRPARQHVLTVIGVPASGETTVDGLDRCWANANLP